MVLCQTMHPCVVLGSDDPLPVGVPDDDDLLPLLPGVAPNGRDLLVLVPVTDLVTKGGCELQHRMSYRVPGCLMQPSDLQALSLISLGLLPVGCGHKKRMEGVTRPGRQSHPGQTMVSQH